MDDKEKKSEPIEVSEFSGEAHNEESKYGGFVRIGEVQDDSSFGLPIGDSTGYVAPSEEYEVQTSKDSVEGLCSSPVPENLIEVVKNREDSSAIGEREESMDCVDYDGFHSVAVGEVEKKEESVSNGLTLQSSAPMNAFFEECGDKEDYNASRESYVDNQETLKEVKLDSGDVNITNGETETRNSCEDLQDKVKTSPHEDDKEKVVHVTQEDVEGVSKKPADEQEELGGQEYLSLEISNKDVTAFCDHIDKPFKNEKAIVDNDDDDDDDWGDFAAAEIAEEERAKGEEEFGSFVDASPGTISMPDLLNEQPDGGWDARFHDIHKGVDSMTIQQQGGTGSDEEEAFVARVTEIFLAIPSVGSPQMLSDIINKDDELNHPPVPCTLRVMPPWNPLQVLNKWTVDLLLSRIPPVSDTVEVEEKETADLYGASTRMNASNMSSSGLLNLSSKDVLSGPSYCHDSANRIRVGKGELPPIGTIDGATVSSPQGMMTKDGLPNSTLTREGLMAEDSSVNNVSVVAAQTLGVEKMIQKSPFDDMTDLEDVKQSVDVANIVVPELPYVFSDIIVPIPEMDTPPCVAEPSWQEPGESCADFPKNAETFGR